MPVYEFQCARDHVTEDLVPIGTDSAPCAQCKAEGFDRVGLRILSATRTDFEFADQRRKRSIE